MSEIPKPSDSVLRGKLLKTVAADAGPLVVGNLRGSLVPVPEATGGLVIPEDYDLPETAVKQINDRIRLEDRTPFEDPNGVIVAGQIFTSSIDPSHRRMVTSVYTRPSTGRSVADVHIEGSPGVSGGLSLEAVQQKIDEGVLAPVPPISPK